MKKVLILLLMIGVLMLGTCALAEEVCENYSQRYIEFSENKSFTTHGNEDPCGGEGSDGPPIPG